MSVESTGASGSGRTTIGAGWTWPCPQFPGCDTGERLPRGGSVLGMRLRAQKASATCLGRSPLIEAKSLFPLPKRRKTTTNTSLLPLQKNQTARPLRVRCGHTTRCAGRIGRRWRPSRGLGRAMAGRPARGAQRESRESRVGRGLSPPCRSVPGTALGDDGSSPLNAKMALRAWICGWFWLWGPG